MWSCPLGKIKPNPATCSGCRLVLSRDTALAMAVGSVCSLSPATQRVLAGHRRGSPVPGVGCARLEGRVARACDGRHVSSSSPAGSYKWHVCSLEEHGWREEGEALVALRGVLGFAVTPLLWRGLALGSWGQL